MINPWNDFPESNCMVHPDDKELVDAHNRSVKEKYRFILHLAPEPWIGDINAPVVVLLANPGATDSDLGGFSEPKADVIVRSALKNLRQEKSDYPHFFFDPILEGTQGQNWYFKAFKTLLNEFGPSQLSKSILTCEMAPYHSKNWLKPSAEFSTQAYTHSLVRRAMERNAIVLIHRAARHWMAEIPALKEYSKAFRPKSSQSMYVSPGNYPGAIQELRSAINKI